MTAPATLLVQHPTWDEAIVLDMDVREPDALRVWGAGDVRVDERFTLTGTVFTARCGSELRAHGRPLLFDTPQAAADALANLIETTPELASLRPRSTS